MLRASSVPVFPVQRPGSREKPAKASGGLSETPGMMIVRRSSVRKTPAGPNREDEPCPAPVFSFELFPFPGRREAPRQKIIISFASAFSSKRIIFSWNVGRNMAGIGIASISLLVHIPARPHWSALLFPSEKNFSLVRPQSVPLPTGCSCFLKSPWRWPDSRPGFVGSFGPSWGVLDFFNKK